MRKSNVLGTLLTLMLTSFICPPIVLGQDCGNTGGTNGRSHENCTNLNLSTMPRKKIRVTIHVFQDNSGNGNYTTSHISDLEDLIDDVNSRISNMPTFSGNPTASVSDLKIEFDLKNIYFYQNTTMHQKANNSHANGEDLYDYVTSQSIQYKYNSIHILIPGNNPNDSDLEGRACGIGCKDWAILENAYQWRNSPNELERLIAHELGHNLNLYHSSGSDSCSDTPSSCSNNNIMKACYGTNRDALSHCQAGRMHRWVVDDAPELLSGGSQSSSLAGSISSSNGTTSMVCCTQNIAASSATITITSQPGETINWTGSGSGTFSSSNNGHTLNVSNLGSVVLTASWNENCKDFTQGWVFYNGGSYYSLAPSPASHFVDVTFSNSEEWLAITSPGSSNRDQAYIDTWTIKDQYGLIHKRGKLGVGVSKFKINVSKLQPGLYYITLVKGNTVDTIAFVKV